MYPVELDIKDKTESNTSPSYLDLLVSDFKIPFMKNVTISISKPLTFRFRVVIFYLHQPMTFSTHNLYDKLAPHVEVLF